MFNLIKKGHKILSSPSLSVGLYSRTNALKQRNPSLRVLLAVGGWAIGSRPFTPITRDPENQRYFVRHLVHYLRTNDFDGLDMDWEFPGARGSPSQDKYRFTTLMQVGACIPLSTDMYPMNLPQGHNAP